ncbi:hypothetical protein MMC13_002017 [Lambiella insularis]|nr:hypothetical protein [Lambiella insularis]
MFFATLFNCVPVEFFWNRELPGGGTCIDLLQFAYGNGITNLLLDAMVLSLPFPMLWRLQMDAKTKISLCLIFTLGFFVCAVSIIRITNISAFGSGADPTWGATGIYIWSQVEPACGIIGASLPCMRPLISRRYLPWGTRASSGYASNGSPWGTNRSKKTGGSVGVGSQNGIKNAIKGGHSAGGNGGFSRMTDEEQQPINMNNLVIERTIDVQVEREDYRE